MVGVRVIVGVSVIEGMGVKVGEGVCVAATLVVGTDVAVLTACPPGVIPQAVSISTMLIKAIECFLTSLPRECRCEEAAFPDEAISSRGMAEELHEMLGLLREVRSQRQEPEILYCGKSLN